jgi:large subunit ribosomal protein L21
MYAVVNSGGKQYKVRQGDLLRVEKISGDVGSPVAFDRVMMYSDGENVSIGQPLLDSVAVEGHIVEQGKAKKIIVFKYKRRKRFRRKNGHRQEFTAVLIDSIKAKGAKVAGPIAEAGAEIKQSEAGAEDKQPEVKEAAPKKEAAKETAAKKPAPPKVPAEKAKAKPEVKDPEAKEE